MEKLYCPECGNYLEGGDGSMVDCHCGWKQERSLSSDEDEIEQLRQRVQELEFALAETEALEISHGERIDKLMKAIKELYFGYVRLIENGRNRIMMLGGDCDSVQYMEENDPLLIETRKIFK